MRFFFTMRLIKNAQVAPFYTTCSILALETSEHPTDIYLFKVNNRNIRKRCKICSKSTIKTMTSMTFWCFYY